MIEKADRFKKPNPENDNVIEVETQINDLKNIIAYENANVMNKFQNWETEEDEVKDVVEGEDVVLECRFSPSLSGTEGTLSIAVV